MPSTPYDSVMVVINAAKQRLNDDITTLAAIGGKILDNTSPFSQQAVNGAWRKLQEFLAELGYSGLKQEALLSNVPAAAVTDPAVQVYIGFNGYFDGSAVQASPVLPQSLIRPYDLWERAYGSAALMTEMDYVINGLPKVPKLQWNRQWEWRDDVLYMPGAIVATDILMRYAQQFLDFVDVGATAGLYQTANTPWFAQPVPIMRCVDAFADYVCREFAIAVKQMEEAMAFQASAEANARLIMNRDTAQPRAVLKASELGKMRDRYTPGGAPPLAQ